MDWIQWGNVPEAVACLLSVAAVWITWQARRDSRASARAAERSADAAERSARAEEAALADQRAAAAPKVELVIESVKKSAYRIRNHGNLTARSVELVERPDALSPRDPEPIGDLAPNQSWRFLDMSTMQAQMPGSLQVTWEGQTEPVHLPMP